MRKTELNEQISKLEKAIKSSFTPEALKPDMEVKLQELRKVLENKEKQEKEEATKKEESKQTSKESIEKQEVKKTDPEKAQTPKPEGEKPSEKKETVPKKDVNQKTKKEEKKVLPVYSKGDQIFYRAFTEQPVIDKIIDVDSEHYYIGKRWGKAKEIEKDKKYQVKIRTGNFFFSTYHPPKFKKGQQITFKDKKEIIIDKITDIDEQHYYLERGWKDKEGKIAKKPTTLIVLGNALFEAYDPSKQKEEKKETRPAKRNRRGMKKEDVPGCEVVLNELAVIVNKYKEGTTTSQKKPATKKKVQHQFGTKLKKGINLDVGRAITNRIKKAGGVEKLNIEKFERDYQKVEQTAEEFIKALVKLSRNVATKSQEKSMADALVGELKERFQNIKDKYEKKNEGGRHSAGRHSDGKQAA